MHWKTYLYPEDFELKIPNSYRLKDLFGHIFFFEKAQSDPLAFGGAITITSTPRFSGCFNDYPTNWASR